MSDLGVKSDVKKYDLGAKGLIFGLVWGKIVLEMR